MKSLPRSRHETSGLGMEHCYRETGQKSPSGGFPKRPPPAPSRRDIIISFIISFFFFYFFPGTELQLGPRVPVKYSATEPTLLWHFNMKHSVQADFARPTLNLLLGPILSRSWDSRSVPPDSACSSLWSWGLKTRYHSYWASAHSELQPCPVCFPYEWMSLKVNFISLLTYWDHVDLVSLELSM